MAEHSLQNLAGILAAFDREFTTLDMLGVFKPGKCVGGISATFTLARSRRVRRLVGISPERTQSTGI